MPTLQDAAKSDFNELYLHAKDIIHEQNCDSFCKPIIQFLVDGELPHNRKEARAVILRQEDYVILNDILYHIFTPFGSKLSGSTAQLVAPQSLISTVLSYHHDTTYKGHLGISKLISTLRPKFFWPKMIKNLVEYYHSCETCNSTKQSTRPLHPLMTLFDQAMAPFEHIEKPIH